MNPLRAIRRHIFGLDQQAFAEIARTSQATVSRWENGRLVPNALAMAAIRDEARRRQLNWSDRFFFEPVQPSDVSPIWSPADIKASSLAEEAA